MRHDKTEAVLPEGRVVEEGDAGFAQLNEDLTTDLLFPTARLKVIPMGSSI